MRTTLLTLGALCASACGLGPDDWKDWEPPPPCGCRADPVVPATGEVTLRPHVDDGTYLGSVISFEWASTDVEKANNDWDVSLEPSTKVRGAFAFRANTVTDDESCIEDLGPIALADVPARESSACGDFPAVVEGHVYLVHTKDTDSRQYAAFGVKALAADGAATLRWFRSPDPDSFLLSW